MPRGKQLLKHMTKKTPEEEEADQLRRYGIDATGSAKPKYRPLLEATGPDAVITLPGRVRCECQARKHALVNNCLRCGRVVCVQEGSGPCFHCASLVASKEEELAIGSGSKKGRELRLRLLGSAEAPGKGSASLSAIGGALFEAATANKDRLLGYDRDSVRRTRVIDDQADYFASDAWLPAADKARLDAKRAELQAAKTAPRSKQPQKLSLDFMGRRVLEEAPVAAAEAQLIAELAAMEEAAMAAKFAAALQAEESTRDGIAAPGLTFRPRYEGAESGGRAAGETPHAPRVQDVAGFAEMADAGHCLSLHQPYASLLVCGIKKHEGRSWDCDFRGLLWIHAGGKPIPPEEIASVEDFYREFYDGDLPAAFPTAYPRGCIVGCVVVADVLGREDYEARFPGGESGAPFVFVCEAPSELRFQIPAPGAPKVFRLPPNLKAAVAKAKSLGFCY